MELLFTEEFTDETEITVTHNLDRIDVAVRIIQDGGAVDDQIIDEVCFDPSNQRDVIIIKLTQPISGRVQVVDTGTTVVYPSVAIPTITATISGEGETYGSKAAIVDFDTSSGHDSEYFDIVNGLIKCKKSGNHNVSFKVVSKFDKSNRARQHSKSRLAKFDSNGNFIGYVAGSTSPCFHRNGTDGVASMVCSSIEVQMNAGEHIGVICWRHSGRYNLLILPEGTSLSVRLIKES